MNPQEQELITTLLERLKGVGGQPKDPEADQLIRQAVAAQPDMPYYLVQTALIQDLSLHQAQQRIAELQQQVAQVQSKPTSFLGGLFGSSQPASPPATTQPSAGPWSRSPQVAAAPPPGGGYAPQPGYAQQPQGGYAPAGGGMMGGGMMGGMAGMGGGGGFLRSAAATAAGVAGGALLFEGISSMFGHGYANSLGGGMMPGVGESVINNYYGDSGSGGGDYGGGGDSGPGYGGGGPDTGGDYGGGDYGGGGDSGGGDFGGGGDSSSC